MPSNLNRITKSLRRVRPALTRSQAKRLARLCGANFHRFGGGFDYAPWLGDAPGFTPHPLARFYPA